MQYFHDPGLAGLWGQSIGQGLNILAQSKMAQVQQQRTQQQAFNMLKLLGAPAHEAAALSIAPAEIQKKILPDYITALSQRQGEQPQQEMPEPSGMAALQGLSAAAPSQEAALGAPRADIAQTPSTGLPTAQQNAQAFTKQLGIGQGENALNQLMQQKQQQPQPQAQQARQQTQTEQPAATQAQQPQVRRGKPEGWRPLKQKERLDLYKYNKDLRSEVLEGEKAAKTTKMDVGRLEVLNREGKLIDPIAYGILKKAGWDLQGLMTADSGEFLKIQQDFLKNMKAIFGARISITEMEQYIQGIPSLLQTPEGRERVFRNFRIMADIAEERANMLRQVEKEYGYAPENEDSLIAERMNPYYDQKIKEFAEGAKRPQLKPGDHINIDQIPAFTVPGLRAIRKNGEKVVSDGAKWVPRE